MRYVVITIAVVLLLAGCGVSVGMVGVWHFGDGSDSYGIVSLTNEMGFTSSFLIGNKYYGPIMDGETIIIHLKRGSYWIRDQYGHSRYITINDTETIFLIFS